MSVIEDGQREGSSKGNEKNGSDFQFYGGMIWKQKKYTSEYQYNYTPGTSVADGDNKDYKTKNEPIQFFNFKTV